MTVVTTTNKCRICGNKDDNKVFTVREMMLGLRDEFEYIECARCGCLHIKAIPDDMTPYYPSGYYSFEEPENPGALKRFLKRLRAAHALGNKNLLGRLLVGRYGVPTICRWVRRAGVGFDDAILDVGCGNGTRLLDMYASGFSNLSGIDPYIEQYVNHKGVRIRRCELAECDGEFDLVMLNHAFEHMADPFKTLEHIYRLLKPGRHALIRTPVAGKYVHRSYGADWVQIDAPRHLCVHTESSIRLCAERTGFEVAHIEFDSTSFGFWASEQYQRDVPLVDDTSYAKNPKQSMFKPAEIVRFETIAVGLNEEHDGDQACFYLRRR